jgi:hypothetical protein
VSFSICLDSILLFFFLVFVFFFLLLACNCDMGTIYKLKSRFISDLGWGGHEISRSGSLGPWCRCICSAFLRISYASVVWVPQPRLH